MSGLRPHHVVPEAVLTISSENYSSWCLRGWLMCKLAGLVFAEEVVPVEDPAARAELLLLSPSFLVPCLHHDTQVVRAPLSAARDGDGGQESKSGSPSP
jgi:glutathione S-transferase